MGSAYYQPLSDRLRAPLGRRATGFLLALAVELLIALALWMMETSRPPPPKAEPRSTSFQLMPEPQEAPKPSPRPKAVAKVKHASGGASRRLPTPQAPVTAAPQEAPPQLLVLSKDEFAASNIANIPSHHNDDDSGDGAGSGKDSGSVYGPGEGPGGERLYDAEWYREPSHAEMATYMPPGAQTGWGMIACKTIPNYHVENCRQLGESPVGSGLSRAMRLASWQFLVRPPRVGGHAIMGAWVRIRFDLTVGVEKK